MINKKEFILGFFIGIIATFLGSFIFLIAFTKCNDFTDLIIIKNEGILGKIVTLGALFNLLLFLISMKLNRETIAKGIVLATIILALLTTLL
jgi:hypothetical protein